MFSKLAPRLTQSISYSVNIHFRVFGDAVSAKIWTNYLLVVFVKMVCIMIKKNIYIYFQFFFSNDWGVFKASALWADAFYKSKCPFVCPSVRLCVCSLLRYRLTVFLPPLPEVGCPIFLEIRNPWGKVMGRSGLTF